MKLENQVCTPEQGKRLKELGVFENALFYHTWNIALKKYEPIKQRRDLQSVKAHGTVVDGGCIVYIPAYSTSELGAMLPMDNDKVMDNLPVNTSHKMQDIFNPVFVASLVIYLLENNHITPPEVNQRLKD